MAVSASQYPYTGPYSVEGNGKHKGPTATSNKRGLSRLGFLPWEPDVWDDVWNKKLEAAWDEFDPGKDGYGDGRWRKIRAAMIPAGLPNAGQPALDAECLRLVQEEAKPQQPWRSLGPVFNGGATVLMHDLTHATSGLPKTSSGKSLWPAFDDAFTVGTAIIAPEKIKVVQASSSSPGDACYADGVASGIDYWFGHLVEAPAVGRTIAKGALIGKVCKNSKGGGPHVHVAVNVERLWGAGKMLAHKTTYQHGAPLIGDQLAARDL